MDGEEGRGLRWQTAHAGLRRLGHRQPLELVRSHRVHAPLPRREDRSLRERVQPTGAHEGRRRRLKHVPIATALSRVGEGFFVYIEIPVRREGDEPRQYHQSILDEMQITPPARKLTAVDVLPR